MMPTRRWGLGLERITSAPVLGAGAVALGRCPGQDAVRMRGCMSPVGRASIAMTRRAA